MSVFKNSIYVCVCMCVHMCACMCVHVNVHTRVCVCIHMTYEGSCLGGQKYRPLQLELEPPNMGRWELNLGSLQEPYRLIRAEPSLQLANML